MKLLSEFDTSVRRALSEIDPKWEKYNGLIVCGTHSPKNVEEEIQAIKEARENKTPFLGICHGHQLAAIEYARNVLGIKDACSEEWGNGSYIVTQLDKLKVGLFPVGSYKDTTMESFWNHYEVAEGFDTIWQNPEHFFTAQFHPEYQSSKDKPHPLLVKFLEYAKRSN